MRELLVEVESLVMERARGWQTRLGFPSRRQRRTQGESFLGSTSTRVRASGVGLVPTRGLVGVVRREKEGGRVLYLIIHEDCLVECERVGWGGEEEGSEGPD